jgi:hypothetical protein
VEKLTSRESGLVAIPSSSGTKVQGSASGTAWAKGDPELDRPRNGAGSPKANFEQDPQRTGLVHAVDAEEGRPV